MQAAIHVPRSLARSLCLCLALLVINSRIWAVDAEEDYSEDDTECGELTTELSNSKYQKIRNELEEEFSKLPAGAKEAASKNIKLPELVVIGEQSAGKTTALEMIAGMNFLPRGSGTCTTRPFEIDLMHGDKQIVEVAKEDGTVVESYTPPFKTLQAYLATQNDENKKILTAPVNLRVSSPHFPVGFRLRLVDLPGLVDGDSASRADMAAQIKELMLKRTVDNKEAIFLLVHSSDTDESNDRGFSFVEDNKLGDRTIGVITKLNKADNLRKPETQALLDGSSNGVVKEWFGITGQSQEDIDKSVTVKAAIQGETKLFESKGGLNAACEQHLGTGKLVKRLISKLDSHIKESLQSKQKDIKNKMKAAQDEQNALPKSPATGDHDRKSHVTDILAEVLAGYIEQDQEREKFEYKEDDSDAPRQELFKTFFDADNYSNITVDQAKKCASQDLMRAEMQPCFREMMVPEIEQLWGPIEVYLAGEEKRILKNIDQIRDLSKQKKTAKTLRITWATLEKHEDLTEQVFTAVTRELKKKVNTCEGHLKIVYETKKNEPHLMIRKTEQAQSKSASKSAKKKKAGNKQLTKCEELFIARQANTLFTAELLYCLVKPMTETLREQLYTTTIESMGYHVLSTLSTSANKAGTSSQDATKLAKAMVSKSDSFEANIEKWIKDEEYWNEAAQVGADRARLRNEISAYETAAEVFEKYGM